MDDDVQGAFERAVLRIYDDAATRVLWAREAAGGMAMALSILLEEARRTGMVYRNSRIQQINPADLVLKRR